MAPTDFFLSAAQHREIVELRYFPRNNAKSNQLMTISNSCRKFKKLKTPTSSQASVDAPEVSTYIRDGSLRLSAKLLGDRYEKVPRKNFTPKFQNFFENIYVFDSFFGLKCKRNMAYTKIRTCDLWICKIYKVGTMEKFWNEGPEISGKQIDFGIVFDEKYNLYLASNPQPVPSEPCCQGIPTYSPEYNYW